MPIKDPRSYVQSKPLPISTQKGLKIQARSFEVYNPTDPSRSVVRGQNYSRRSAQLSSQGFRSVNYKPYHGIGDPFYLDHKKMILHALGQWEESQEWETSSSSDEDDSTADPLSVQQGQMTAAKFVLRRTRKDLNTLNKEVLKWRNTIRNVRLGHGLFDLIRQERNTKRVAAMADKQKKMEEARNTWQPPKRNSDSEEESDEDTVDMDFDRYSPLPDDSSTHISPSQTKSTPRPKKKKGTIPRPFTPKHSSLCEIGDSSEDISKSALFRQLCVLNWILDAMNIEPGNTMSSIMTCWSHNEIGGLKIPSKKAQQEKQAETRWERFLSTPMPGKFKKFSSARGGRFPRASLRYLSNPRTSLQSTSPTPSSSSSALNLVPGFGASVTSTTTSAVPREDTILEEASLSTTPLPMEAEDEAWVDTAQSRSMFKFLDEYYDSLPSEARVEEDGRQGPDALQSGNPNTTSETPEKSTDAEKHAKKHRKKSREREKTPDKLALYDMQEALGVPRGLRADKVVKPKPSPELLEFHEKKPSNKYQMLSTDLASRFKEVQDDKAMTLHDILEQMERERLAKCQSKFVSMRTQSNSVYRALEAMRREGEKMLQKPNDEQMRRKSSVRDNWYTELIQNIPTRLRSVWYYNTILNKLCKYGLVLVEDENVESTSKQSVYKFLKVLEGLREWEICSPDIAAAIEFCRERIVDLSVEEYEEWFSSVFPRINRPQTAPAAIHTEKKEAADHNRVNCTAAGVGKGVTRQTRSAFVSRSQS